MGPCLEFVTYAPRALRLRVFSRTSRSAGAIRLRRPRRAGIEPWAWLINNSLLATGSRAPLLRARMKAEAEQVARVVHGQAQRVALIPWVAGEPVGVERLRALVAPAAGAHRAADLDVAAHEGGSMRVVFILGGGWREPVARCMNGQPVSFPAEGAPPGAQ